MSAATVLFFAADPLSTPPRGIPRLQLDEDFRRIQQNVRAAEHRHGLRFDLRPAARPDDLIQALNEVRPAVVHFSGHGGSEGLVLVGADGGPHQVGTEALRKLFDVFRGDIRVVVLNACLSLAQARAIAEAVGCAIGTRDRISDEASITFGASFYRALAFGHSVQTAFEQARVALALEHPGEEEVPEIIAGPGVDPSLIFIVPDARGPVQGDGSAPAAAPTTRETQGSAVFIGATGTDLKEYRRAAVETCTRLGLVPVGPEPFESMSPGAAEASRRILRDAALYVGVFAHRYGYVEPGHRRGIVEEELDYAGELGVERLCFVVDPALPWPPESIDYASRDRLLELKRRVSRTGSFTAFTTVDDFRAKLAEALAVRRGTPGTPASPPPAHPVRGTAPAAAVHLAPPAPPLLIGRETDQERLLARLGIPSGTARAVTIIRGWPGVGKTTVVTALAHDARVAAAFEGVLWASLGESGSPLAALGGWLRELDDGSGAPPDTLETAVARTRARLAARRFLLIVDDVWEAEAAVPFKAAGAGSPLLFTTRFPAVARELAPVPDDEYRLEQLDNEQGFALFRQMAPTVARGHEAESRRLVAALEGLPLAIRVAGRLLEAEIRLGWGVAELFAEVASGTTLLDEKAPDDRWDPATGVIPTVGLLLQKSSDRLDPVTRERFALLGAFAPKPATFDLPAMAFVWEVDDSRPTARTLADRGLLEPILGTDRFQMHAVLVLHARALLDDEEE
jgi:hypothetical protein